MRQRFGDNIRMLKRICQLALCCMVVLVLVPQTAVAAGNSRVKLTVDPVVHRDNCSAVLYNNTNGLPTSEANAIAETSEGFIWIGSYGGLVRYDGNTFERMDSTKGIGSVVSLYVDSRDRLWIGTNESGLALLENGEYTFWSEKEGLPGDRVSTIAEDNKGIIYAGTTAGIVMINPDMELSSIEDPRIAGTFIEHMTCGPDGLMYVTTNEDDCFTLSDGKVKDYISHSDSRITDISALLPDPDKAGMVYAGTGDSTLYYTDMNLDPAASETVDIAPLSGVISLRKIDGKVWICARNGIGVVDDQGFHHLSELPMDNSVTDVMPDYEGGLWFVSTRQGVMKLVSNKFFNVFERFKLDDAVVNSTCVLHGRLFVGTDTGLIVLDDDKPVTELPLTSVYAASGEDLGAGDLIKLLEDNRIRSIIKDSRDRLWISTWLGVGLVCYDSSGTATVFTEHDGLFSDHIRAVYEANDGSVLVANTGGVNIIRDGKVVAGYDKDSGINNPEILTVCQAPDGDIMLGSNGDGIYIIGEKETKHITKADGLSSEIIMRIKYDRERKLFWLVTSNAIAYMTDDYKVTTVTSFPYSNNFDIYENSKGDMWILSSNGIYVAKAEELIENEDIRPVHYSIANGLPCITTSNSYSFVTPEGLLYIAGNSGVVQVNIEESLEQIDNLKQAVPFIEADGKFYYPTEDNSFILPSGVQRVTIYGFIYNYSLTDPQVSYRLLGFDRRPITVNRSNFDPVTYTNLRGGTYRFNMELRDAMGRGSKSISVKIIKEKAIYEQTWFYLLAAALLALAVLAVARAYVRRKVRIMEERHRERAERERIAHELSVAGRIQEAMLPREYPAFPERNEFDIYAAMQPAREVGGDFYDYFLIDDDHLCLVIADVAGKGVPAALYMMISKVMLQIFADMEQSAAEILEKINDRLTARDNYDMFVTVWLGILEISTGRITAANAGHEYPVIKRSGSEYRLIKDKHSIVVGGLEGAIYKEYVLKLNPGDKLFLYTDGVPEATDAQNAMFGTDRMVETLNRDPDAAPSEVLANVHSTVKSFVGKAEQFDDMTMLCLEYNGKSPEETVSVTAEDAEESRL